MTDLSAVERQQAILEYLCLKRFDTTKNLAKLFNVCERTIRYDIVALSYKYPIETSVGLYGGVYVANWFHLDRVLLSPEQVACLKRIRENLNEEDTRIVDSILKRFALGL